MGEALRKIRSELRIRPAKVKRRLMEFIKGKVEEAGASGVVLGSVSYTHLTLPTICSV